MTHSLSRYQTFLTPLVAPEWVKTAVTAKADEFAPGIPAERETKPLPRIRNPQLWEMALQQHAASRDHADLRLVDPKGRAHSWAIPKSRLPDPGEKLWVVQQPTHTREYAAKKGPFTIESGYGAGKVVGSGLKPVEVVHSNDTITRFNTYEGRQPQEFALIHTKGGGQLLYNITATPESGVRGPRGYAVPLYRPPYREKKLDAVTFDDPNTIHQAKIDGAHSTVHIPAENKQVRFFSHRQPKGGGLIEYTHKLPNYHKLRAPKDVAGTVLRAELWAADKQGHALPAEAVGGMLNAGVLKSRQIQQQKGKLRPAIFDVVRYKGKNVENEPYARKLEILKDVAQKMPQLKLPPTAETTAQKERLLARIQQGKLNETKEGIVEWRKDSPRPTKAKLRPDVDAEIVGTFPGKGKYTGSAGGFLVKLPGKATVSRVGTGFSDKMRKHMADHPEQYVGRVARVETQQVFPSGKLRAPSFKELHIEKGRQDEMVKEAIWEGFYDEMRKIAYSPSGHEDVTVDALARLEKRLGRASFTEAQKKRLISANRETDAPHVRRLFLSRRAQPFHHTDDQVRQARALIRKHLQQAQQSKDTDEALDALGIALHTTQDRRSHADMGIRATPLGFIRHNLIRADNPQKHPEQYRKARSDTERLLRRYFRGQAQPLGDPTDRPRQVIALLPKER